MFYPVKGFRLVERDEATRSANLCRVSEQIARQCQGRENRATWYATRLRLTYNIRQDGTGASGQNGCYNLVVSVQECDRSIRLGLRRISAWFRYQDYAALPEGFRPHSVEKKAVHHIEERTLNGGKKLFVKSSRDPVRPLSTEYIFPACVSLSSCAFTGVLDTSIYVTCAFEPRSAK